MGRKIAKAKKAAAAETKAAEVIQGAFRQHMARKLGQKWKKSVQEKLLKGQHTPLRNQVKRKGGLFESLTGQIKTRDALKTSSNIRFGQRANLFSGIRKNVGKGRTKDLVGRFEERAAQETIGALADARRGANIKRIKNSLGISNTAVPLVKKQTYTTSANIIKKVEKRGATTQSTGGVSFQNKIDKAITKGNNLVPVARQPPKVAKVNAPPPAAPAAPPPTRPPRPGQTVRIEKPQVRAESGFSNPIYGNLPGTRGTSGFSNPVYGELVPPPLPQQFTSNF